MRAFLLLIFTISVLSNTSPDEEKINELRKEYFQEINKIEPGLNHQIINNEIRNEKARFRNYKKSLFLHNEYDGGLKGYWREKGSDNQSGRVHSADIDFPNDLIYVASDGGGVWRGTIDGEDWTVLNDTWSFGSIRKVKVYYINGVKRIVAVSSNRTFITENEGETWTVSEGLENVERWGGITEVATTNDGEIYVIGQEWDYGSDWRSERFVYYSNDHGSSFEKIRNMMPSNRQISIWSPYNSSKVFLAEQDNIISYENGNQVDSTKIIDVDINESFEEGLVNRMTIRGIINDDKIQILYVLRVNENGNYVNTYFYSEENNFEKWELTGDFDEFDFWSYNSSNHKKGHIYWGNVNTVRTYNGGRNWEIVNTWGEYYADPLNKLHADIPSMNVFDDPETGDEIILISTDGGLYISRDDLQSVTNLSLHGLKISQYYDVSTSADGKVVYAGSQDQGFQRCLDDSSTVLSFDQLISGDYGQFASADGGQTHWSVYPTFAHVYFNSDTENESRKSWGFPGRGWKFMAPTAPFYGDPNQIYISGGSESGQQFLWKLDADGTEIKPDLVDLDFTLQNNEWISAIGTTPNDVNIVCILTSNGRFAKSLDQGASWQLNENFVGPGPHYFHGSAIIIGGEDNEKIAISGSGYSNPGFYLSNDGGETFEAFEEGIASTMIYDIEFSGDEEYIFAATAVGPYLFDGEKWIDIQEGAPDQAYWSVEWVPALELARFGTYGRGIWDFKIGQDLVSVEEERDLSIDLYPNPTNSVFNLSFGKNQEAELKIYDQEGKVVKIEKIFGNSQINVSELSVGSYMVIVNSKGRTYFEKLIVE